MIYFISFLFSLIFSVSSLGNVSMQTMNTALTLNQNNVILTSESGDSYTNLEFNGNEHYLGLQDATHIAISNNLLYYSTNSSIYEYNFVSKTLTHILDMDNIEKLSYAGNKLYAYKNKTLYLVDIIEKTYSEFIKCDMYSFYEENGVTYFSKILNNTFKLITIKNDIREEIFTLELVTSLNLINITNTANNSYIVLKQSNATKIIYINHTERVRKDLTNYNMDNSNIMYLTNKGEKPVFIDYTESFLCAVYDNFIQYNDTKILLSTQGDYGFETGIYYKIKDYTVYNNKFYVLDSIYGAIQEFSFNDGITFEKVITSSSAYTAGKFFNPTSFKAINKNTVLVADTNNKAIQVINNNVSTLISSYNNESATTEEEKVVNFEYPIKILANNTNYYILQKNTSDEFEILILDFNFNLINKVTHNLSNICDIELVQNTLYIADNVTNKIYKYEQSLMTELDSSLINFTLTAQTKLDYMPECNTLAILCDNILYLLNFNISTTKFINLPESGNALSSDYFKNIYVLTNDKILKYSTLEPSKEAEEINLNNNYSYFSIEKDTGNVYLFNNKNQNFVLLKTNNINSLINNFTHPVNLSDYKSEKVVTIAKTNENVYVYDYPYNNGLSYKISNENVYVLSEEFLDYYYICFKYNYNNAYILKTGYILKNEVTFETYKTLPISQNLKVVSNTKIYSLPTLLKYENENLFMGDLTNGNYISTKYELLNKDTLSIDNCDFYAVKVGNNFGYVKAIDVIKDNVIHTEEILKPNAKLIVSEDKYNTVYVYAGNSSIVIDKLLVGKKVYVESYDINKKYTLIKYLDEDNHEHTGYILTKCIKLDNNSRTNNSAIILIVLSSLAIIGVSAFYIISHIKQQHKQKTSNDKDVIK